MSGLGGYAAINEFISVAGLRVDGRRRDEIRRIRTRLGVFQRVDGSCYYEQGNTKVQAIVYGPREKMQSHASSGIGSIGSGSGNAASNTTPRAVVQCEFSQAPFATAERKKTFSERKRSEISTAIKQIFESCILTHLYPRSQIDISVQVLQADGGELPACINAITLALVDAGIAMSDFVVASSAGYLQQTLLCDLNYVEESARPPQLIIAINPRSQNINLLQMECKLPLDMFESLMEIGIDGCNQIFELLVNSVREHTWKLLRSRGTALS